MNYREAVERELFHALDVEATRLRQMGYTIEQARKELETRLRQFVTQMVPRFPDINRLEREAYRLLRDVLKVEF